MASGCAVVASDLPGFRYVAGDAARLVPPGDAPSLAAAVNDQLADPARAVQLGEAARHLSYRFDGAEIAAEYLSAYQDALAS